VFNPSYSMLQPRQGPPHQASNSSESDCSFSRSRCIVFKNRTARSPFSFAPFFACLIILPRGYPFVNRFIRRDGFRNSFDIFPGFPQHIVGNPRPERNEKQLYSN
jgi:hypothetical protein